MEQEREKIEQFIERKTETEPTQEKKEEETDLIKEKKDSQQVSTTSQVKDDQQQEEVKEIEKLKLPGKIERLIKLAETKNLFYAIEIARKTGDGYLIDVFRDRLAEDNYYKRFLK